MGCRQSSPKRVIIKYSNNYIIYLLICTNYCLILFRYPDVHIAIYTGDLEVAPEEMINRVKRTFNIKINPVEFIYLHKRNYVEAEMYPQFTLLAQSIGSYLLGLEAFEALQPGINYYFLNSRTLRDIINNCYFFL